MPDQLTLLFTNIWLTWRGGSETVVRDLALGMLRRGHRPIVYSPTLGEPAAEIAAKGIVVIDDLRKLAEPPDLIHAHHSIPCGEALYHFPNVPAIYTCHAFAHWVEAPPHFPQIAAYVAVDEACRDRLVQAEGIDPARVLLLPNAVDLRRIPERRQPLPALPARVMAFGKAAAVPEIRAACAQLGIAFDTIGYADNRPLAEPESELVGADLVFASARCALEALCCGCAVIVCDARGVAGLVTTGNLDRLRAQNFGLRSLSDPMTVERCIAEIERFDAADAARVSERVRQEADLGKQLDAFENLYRDVLAGSRRPVIMDDAHARAMAQFLHENLPRRPVDSRWPWLEHREALLGSIRHLEAQLADASERAAVAGHAAEARLAETSERLAAAERAALQAGEDFKARLHELEHARAEADRNFQAQLAAASGQLLQLQHERDEALHAREDVSRRLADLRRSRLLKIGRLLRRITGRPATY